MLAPVPDGLNDAVLRLLDLEVQRERVHAAFERRTALLRGLRSVLQAWSAGELDTDQAIVELDRLASHPEH